MNAEFQWWLLILGIVVGGALVYLVLADMRNDPPEPDRPSDDAAAEDDPSGAPDLPGRAWAAESSEPAGPAGVNRP